ncbi:hypothetical protein [Deinococcus sp. NW-56]|uniref:hypothetical protein n=1 Tax=Deinococcus sp. NW-56 TaxID=2080419 RepID=UPI001319F923|nr:hypothetical protein [Deinococcus sp. NW-56]
MKRPTGDAVGNMGSLSHLYELARLDAQRPGNIGAGLKLLEALLNRPGFRPRNGGKA